MTLKLNEIVQYKQTHETYSSVNIRLQKLKYVTKSVFLLVYLQKQCLQ